MAAGDLTTLQAVRQSRLTTDTDTAEDGEIADLITRASVAISRHCGREFVPTASEARTFEFDARGPVLVDPYDLRDVTQVRIDVDTPAPTTLLSTEWRLWPHPARDGVYRGLRLSRWLLRGQRRLVEITGTWGFAAVPVDVEHACIITVATWIGQDKGAFSPLLAIDDDGAPRDARGPALLGAIPPGARKLLAPFCRVV